MTAIGKSRKERLVRGLPFDVSRRGSVLPLIIFAIAFSAYGASVLGAVLTPAIGAKIAFAVFAGVCIANLAIIGHDTAHQSFTRSRWLNRVIGTVAFLPALHPYRAWEHHHNRVHHRYTAQIGVDNAYSPMTPAQYRAASPGRRLYYRFIRSLAGQPFFYLLDIWLPKIFIPAARDGRRFRKADWLDQGLVYAWIPLFVFGLAKVAEIGAVDRAGFTPNIMNAGLFGFLIPFLVWNVFISFVTIVQHTGPRVRWIMPTGRSSTYEQKLRGTVHVSFPDRVDWFFHRVMQHIAHHVNPIIPLYALKTAEEKAVADASGLAVVERWTPAYHWRLVRDCKLYDPERDCWCRFDLQPVR